MGRVEAKVDSKRASHALVFWTHSEALSKAIKQGSAMACSRAKNANGIEVVSLERARSIKRLAVVNLQNLNAEGLN
jgi:hypothetical protein